MLSPWAVICDSRDRFLIASIVGTFAVQSPYPKRSFSCAVLLYIEGAVHQDLTYSSIYGRPVLIAWQIVSHQHGNTILFTNGGKPIR